MKLALPMHVEDTKSAIIGISMLNPHFTKQNIHATVETVRNEYERIFFMLPDKPAIHTLAGYGYSPDEAANTAARKFKPLQRHCRTSIEALGLDNAAIVQWEQFEAGDSYQGMLRRLNGLYKNDARFQEDARAVTRGVYEHSQFPKKKEMSLDEQTDAGIAFLLEELAFILSSPDILNVEKTEYLYHRAMPILTDLLIGKYDFVAPTNVSFTLVENKPKPPSSSPSALRR